MVKKEEAKSIDYPEPQSTEERPLGAQPVNIKPKSEKEKKPKEKEIKEKKPKEKKIEEISDLSGIGPATIEKLAEHGVYSLLDLAAQTQEELNDKVGIGGTSARKIIAEAKKYADMDFKTGIDIQILREKLYKISTGSPKFDELIGGGVEAGSITEVFGEYASSKTQVAHSLVVNCIKEHPKDFVVFIDSEGSFRPERIRDFSAGLGLDGEKVLKQILVVRALNSNHQVAMTEKINDLIGKDKKIIKLVVVDSLTTYFRAEYLGRGKLNERQQKLNRYMHTLMKLANINNLVVLITNQVMFRPDAMFGDPISAIGGAIVAHACLVDTTKVLTKKGIVDIKDLVKGDLIFNGYSFVKVKHVSKSKKEVFGIKCGNIIEASANHKFPVLVGDSVKDIQVKNLKKGDKLFFLNKFNGIKNDLKINIIDSKKLVKLDVLLRQKIKNSLIGNFKNNVALEQYVGLTIRTLRAIINQNDHLFLNCAKKLVKFALKREIIEGEYIFFKTIKSRNVNFPEFLDDDFAYLFGMWLADGTKSDKRSVRIKDAYGSYLFECSKTFSKKFGIDCKVKKVKDKNYYELNINSVEIVKNLQNLRKNIGKLIFCEKEIVLNFLGGLFTHDGNVANYSIRFDQVDKKLIDIVGFLLKKAGIDFSVRINKPNSEWGKNEVYCLNLKGNNKELILNYIRNKNKVNKFIKSKLNQKKNNEVFKYEKIKEIKKLLVKNVVDIEVEGDYFLANGILTHNSKTRIYLRKGKKGSRVAKLIDSPHLENGEINFLVTGPRLEDVE